MTPTPPARHPVSIVETTAFEQKASKYLGPNERRALLLLLADDPVRGVPVAGLPGLLRLDYADCVVFYSVAENFLEVYLLDILKDAGGPPPTKEDLQIVRKLLSILGKGAIIAIVRRGFRWLWEHIKDDIPPMG
jgi:hypothetical protein